MKFTCSKSVLLKEILIAQEIISARNALSILSNIFIEAGHNKLTIKATDLKVSFETKIPVQVFETGNTTVFCDKFLNIIRNLPETEIDFIVQDNIMSIVPHEQNIDFKLKCISSEKYPEIKSITNDQYFQLPQFEFINMISHTIFSISDDETRYFMNGVYFEKNENKLIMVSTDGRRLSYIENDFEYDIEPFEGVIIPPKVLNLVKKLSSGEGNLYIAIVDKNIYIKFDNQKISSSLIEGQFPNYKRVIPEKQEHTVVVDKAKLNQAVKRVSLLAEHKSRRIFVVLNENKLILKSEENDIGNAMEEVECEYTGPENTIALNYTYVVEPLKVIDGEDIEICYTDPDRAVTIYSSPKLNFFHIIMPMQVD